jgi:protein ImuB
MSLAEARSLCESVGKDRSLLMELVAEPSDCSADLQALRELALQCQAYSPIAGVGESDRPESLLLDITGCEPHFGGEDSLARLLWNEFASHPYDTRIAVADSVGAAWAGAHFGTTAKCPVVVIPAGQQRGYLRPFPIAGLRLTLPIFETLQKLDIRNIGQLENLPRNTLPARFGKELLRRLDQAWGTAPELITPERFEETLFATWSSEDICSNRETLELITVDLLDRLLAKLLPIRRGIRELEGRMTGVGNVLTLTLRLIQPSADRRHLWDLLRLEWERQEGIALKSSASRSRYQIDGLTSIRLEVVNSSPLKVRQQTLFDLDPDQKQAQSFRQFVERLSSRLGNQAVQCPALASEIQPEFACEFIAWAEMDSKSGSATESLEDRRKAVIARSRPLRLLADPEPLEVLAPIPTGPPSRIWWETRRLEISRTWGPERIETGWWREQSIQRDYYRIETSEGRQLWIFRCLNSGAWFLHGSFD